MARCIRPVLFVALILGLSAFSPRLASASFFDIFTEVTTGVQQGNTTYNSYPSGTTVSGLQMSGFHLWNKVDLGGGGTRISSFFDVFFDITIPGSGSSHVTGTGNEFVVVQPPVSLPLTGSQNYDTKMLQLNITGSSTLGPIMIRESPTLASHGSSTITNLGGGGGGGGGGYKIDSFFDIFTELSWDGGNSWIPANGPMILTGSGGSVPEPASLVAWSLLAGSGVGFGFWRRRRTGR